MSHGVFIVIEGTDGSGKGTQAKILHERLVQEGHEVTAFDFPQYGQPSAYFVEQYLNGRFGQLSEIDAYKGSLFYALDRYDAGFSIRAALERGRVVISNRYVGSNMGHQGGKFGTDEERKNYFAWNEHLEFTVMGIPRPTLNIVLHVPAALAQQLVDNKAARAYTDKPRDLHEADLSHLENAERSYLQMCALFPQQFQLVECSSDGKIDSIDAIAKRIWTATEAVLNR